MPQKRIVFMMLPLFSLVQKTGHREMPCLFILIFSGIVSTGHVLMKP